MRTGKHEPYEVARVRAALVRTAGPKFASKHESSLTSWNHWTDAQIEELWEASSMSNWPDEAARGAKPIHMFEDLLNQSRNPPIRFDESLFELKGTTGEHPDHGEFEVMMVAPDGQSVVTDVGTFPGSEVRKWLAQ